MVATISPDASNLLKGPQAASFDSGSSVTVFKAADLSFIANIPTGASIDPVGAYSDGINFWVNLSGTVNLLRF